MEAASKSQETAASATLQRSSVDSRRLLTRKQIRSSRRLLHPSTPAFFLLLLLSILALPWNRANAAVRFDMFVGYDGIVPQGCWLPVTFEVQNDGDPFIATVEVTPGQLGSGHERSMKVELPTGTTKRFTIPVFSTATWNPVWTARLRDEKRRIQAEAVSRNARRFNAGMLPVAAALSRHLPVLPETKARQDDMRAVFGRMQSSLMPDNPLALDGLDVLYLASERALELKTPQVSALTAWLQSGGHLIVSIEQPNHLAGPGQWLAQLLPCQVEGLGTLTGHNALHQWVSGSMRVDGKLYNFNRSQAGAVAGNPFARLSAESTFEDAAMQVAQVRRRDGSVLIGSEEQPLVITARRGLGQLTVLTFSPELEPFRGWKHAPYFWAKMVDLPPDVLTIEWPSRPGTRPIESIFGAMIDSRQIRKLPIGWLLVLLVAYLLVIGPVDQYWLKKLNRQMLTWITFPAYVAFFSLLIYFIGYKLRAGETEWTELHLVDIVATGPGAEIRGRTYGSIYSPVNARYSFINEVASATFRGEYTGNYGSQESVRGHVEQLAQGCIGDVSVPVWTSQLFISDWSQEAPPPVRLEVDAREVRVINQLNRPLTAARVMIGSQILVLGEIPPSGTKSFERRLLSGSDLTSAVRSQSSPFASIAASRQQVFSGNEGGRIDDWTNAVIAASFISEAASSQREEAFSTPRGFDLSASLDSGQAVLLAWAPDYSMIKPLNRFPARRNQQSTVFRVVSPIQR